MPEDERLEHEPDLDVPGKPLGVKFRHADGTVMTHPIDQTKRDNCASAAAEAGGPDKVTDAHLANWGLTRDEYTAFRIDNAKALAAFNVRQRFFEMMAREFLPDE